MNLDIIARLVQILREAPELGAIEVHRGFFGAWTAVRVSRAGHALGGSDVRSERAFVAERAPAAAPSGPSTLPPEPAGGRRDAAAPAAPHAAAPAAASPFVDIKSPMVGTFYSSPEPGAEPYVKVGSRIATGQMVCIIEAMKIMNEIESEVAGVVREIAVENGHPVEFGQTLFRVDPNA
ncbi:MAG TPA: acetyl-CoA carboxylase biotin carboxyl carrier protein [Gemmatimonadales bacterium]|nr:acetyl-CoA carboxylase biotin carboxyl carrier protein [Gemmatimonadales bacterium]